MRKFNFKYIMLSGLGILAFTACNNLDQLPKDKFTDETFWISVTNSDMVVNMAYRQMYDAKKMWNDESLSDNMFDGRGWGNFRIIRNGLSNPTTGIFADEWKEIYEGIKSCHKYLDNVERVPDMSEEFRNKRKSEVRFIRAWNFFRLVSFYGDVPFFYYGY